jgi:serine protease Do
MRSNFSSRARRWAGASALAIIVALGGASTFVATSQVANAQISVPAVTAPGFADLVEAVKPAVVSIQVEGQETDQSVNRRGGNFEMPDLPDDHPLKKFFDQFGDQFGSNEPQAPRKYLATGSGFVISADGYIVTNDHVVNDATKVTVNFDNGDEMPATVIGVDERTDLAVIKVDGKDLPFVELADKESRVGDWVVAVGNPFGLGGTVTVGVVSARGRDIGGSSYGDFLQIDAAVNSGNSGGPAFNTEGKVIGVNTAIFSPNGGNVGIAFAIPAATVKTIVNSLIDNGSVTRGYLGVAIQDVNRDIADSVGLKTPKGALVTEPTEDGPAAKAGINSGDVILNVDGHDINNALDLSRTIAGKAPGTEVALTIWRDGKETKITVKLETLKEQVADSTAPDKQKPADEPAAPVPSATGVTLVPNAEGEGLLVQEVNPDSVAADKGFAVGDAILEVDNKAVKSAADFETAIKAVKDSGRGTALIKAERGGNVRFIGLPLDAVK